MKHYQWFVHGVAPNGDAKVIRAKGDHARGSQPSRFFAFGKEEAGIKGLAVSASQRRNSPKLTATCIVFSCPTKEISDCQPSLSMTAATNTGPFMAFEAAMNAPSGDQLRVSYWSVEFYSCLPEASEERRGRRVLEWSTNALHKRPVLGVPNLYRFIVRLCSARQC